MESATSPTPLPASNLPQPYSLDPLSATWLEKLLLNLFSYSLVLVPIALVVLASKYKLFPSFLQSSVLVQLFVNGHYYHHQNRSNCSGQDDVTTQDREKLMSRDTSDDGKIPANKRIEPTYGQNDGNNVFKFMCCFSGLMISYLVWGILQEKIMTTKYGKTIHSALINANSSLLNQNSQVMVSSNGSLVIEETHITFHDSQFLVFINRIIAFILAILALIYDRPKRSTSRLIYLSNGKYQVHYRNLHSGEVSNVGGNRESSSKPSAPLYQFVYCSLSNILSSWCQYEALKYVNFPTQVLSKTFKIVPVMIMSKVVLNKKYKPVDYTCALVLSLGMFIFLVYQPPVMSKNGVHHKDHYTTETPLSKQSTDRLGEFNHHPHNRQDLIGGVHSSLLSGLLLLSLYLAFDSFTGNWQKSLFTRYQVTNWQMMAAVNLYSILLTLTSLYQLGNLTPALRMLASCRPLMFDCLLMSVLSSVGQFFVYYTINQFGPVVFTIIMTLRQLLAILISCALYGHQVTTGSSLGILLVFMVVGFQLWHRSSGQQAKTRNPSTELLRQDSIGMKLQSTALSNRSR